MDGNRTIIYVMNISGGAANADQHQPPASREPASRISASGGIWNVPRENKTIIFDNLHQYHLHLFPRTVLPPLPRPWPSLYAGLCLQETTGKLNKPIVSSIDLIWGSENSADSTVLNY